MARMRGPMDMDNLPFSLAPFQHHGLGVVDINLVTGKRTRRASLRDHPRHVATCITIAVDNVVFRSLREDEVIIEMYIVLGVQRNLGITRFKVPTLRSPTSQP